MADALAAQAPGSPRVDGPLVSVIVLNRNGRSHLRRLLPKLDETTYRSSSSSWSTTARPTDRADGSSRGGPIARPRSSATRTTGRSARPTSRASRRPPASCILFLNNDVEPIVDDWLGFMVETRRRREARPRSAPGSSTPAPRGARGPGPRFADLTLQHRGIDFDRADRRPDPARPRRRRGPAGGARAARRRGSRPDRRLPPRPPRGDLEAVGGFDPGYRLRPRGRRPRPQAPGAGVAPRLRRARRAVAPRVVDAARRGAGVRSGARAARTARPSSTAGGPRSSGAPCSTRSRGMASWSEAPFRVGITVTSDDPTARYGDWYTAHELGDALAALGWSIDYLERREDRWYEPERRARGGDRPHRRVRPPARPARHHLDRLDPQLARALARPARGSTTTTSSSASSEPIVEHGPRRQPCKVRLAPADRDQPGPIPAGRARIRRSPATSSSSATTGASRGASSTRCRCWPRKGSRSMSTDVAGTAARVRRAGPRPARLRRRPARLRLGPVRRRRRGRADGSRTARSTRASSTRWRAGRSS